MNELSLDKRGKGSCTPHL